jgi:hypothetical protein
MTDTKDTKGTAGSTPAKAAPTSPARESVTTRSGTAARDSGSGVPAEDSSVVQAVKEGSAPSYRGDAQFTDDDGNVVLAPASLPQLTMPELHGLSDEDVVVPEEGDPALYGFVDVDDDNPDTGVVRETKEARAEARAERNPGRRAQASRSSVSQRRQSKKDKADKDKDAKKE